MSPTVSVIVASFNYGHYIDQCIRSVLGQGYPDLELIVVDDCSTDDSWNRIRSYHDTRINAVRQVQNSGHLDALNRGIALSRGRYIALLGADDFWEPSFLRELVTVLDKHEEVGLAYSAFWLSSEDGTSKPIFHRMIAPTGDSLGNHLSHLLFYNFIPPVSALFRKNCLDYIGGSFPKHVPLSEDWHLWLMIGLRHAVYYRGVALAHYRVHGHNLHLTLKSKDEAITGEFAVLDHFYSSEGLSAELRSLRSMVYAHHCLIQAEICHAKGRPGSCVKWLGHAARWNFRIVISWRFLKRLIAIATRLTWRLPGRAP